MSVCSVSRYHGAIARGQIVIVVGTEGIAMEGTEAATTEDAGELGTATHMKHITSSSVHTCFSDSSSNCPFLMGHSFCLQSGNGSVVGAYRL